MEIQQNPFPGVSPNNDIFKHRLGPKGKSDIRIVFGDSSCRFLAGEKGVAHDQVKSPLCIFSENLFKISGGDLLCKLIFTMVEFLFAPKAGPTCLRKLSWNRADHNSFW
jgi:hypothetical protein